MLQNKKSISIFFLPMLQFYSRHWVYQSSVSDLIKMLLRYQIKCLLLPFSNSKQILENTIETQSSLPVGISMQSRNVNNKKGNLWPFEENIFYMILSKIKVLKDKGMGLRRFIKHLHFSNLNSY